MKIRKKDKKEEYIWHCPGEDCKKRGIILFKTSSPYIGNGKIRCQRCFKEFSLFEVMTRNRRNIELFLKELTINN